MSEEVKPGITLTPTLPWVKCKHCKRTIVLPPEWREFRVDLSETARIVLNVHQKRCAAA